MDKSIDSIIEESDAIFEHISLSICHTRENVLLYSVFYEQLVCTCISYMAMDIVIPAPKGYRFTIFMKKDFRLVE